MSARAPQAALHRRRPRWGQRRRPRQGWRGLVAGAGPARRA